MEGWKEGRKEIRKEIRKEEHYCYIKNTFSFVFTSRQTDDIGTKRPKNVMRQTRPIAQLRDCITTH